MGSFTFLYRYPTRHKKEGPGVTKNRNQGSQSGQKRAGSTPPTSYTRGQNRASCCGEKIGGGAKRLLHQDLYLFIPVHDGKKRVRSHKKRIGRARADKKRRPH